MGSPLGVGEWLEVKHASWEPEAFRVMGQGVAAGGVLTPQAAALLPLSGGAGLYPE